MGKYRKDFDGWAKVAKAVEGREREELYQSGVVYWANLDVNIGSSEDGKGARFTRPVLLLTMMNKTQGLIIPISSQKKQGVNYREILVGGKIEYLLFDQVRTLDMKCIERMVEEVDSITLQRFRRDYLKILK